MPSRLAVPTPGVPPRFTGLATPSGLDPAPEFHPGIPAHGVPCTPLSRGSFPHRRYPAVQSHHPRGFHPPGHVAPSRFLPAATPCSPRRPPRYVSTGRVLGVLPTELDLAGVASASRRRLPSCDWLSGPATHRTWRLRARLARRPPLSFRSGSRGSVPASHAGPARVASASRGLASGVCSLRAFSFRCLSAPSGSGSLPVGARHRRVSPLATSLALLGFSLPGAFSIPCLGPAGWRRHASRRRAPSDPSSFRHPRSRGSAGDCTERSSSRALRKEPPFRVLLPVLQSFKERGMWAGLFRGCRPLRGSCPRPARS
jgi:hypothetical protein